MKSKPKYIIGQSLMYMDKDPSFLYLLDDNMVVSGPAEWYPYDNHPNKGYWQYPIIGKANLCPEDFLIPYKK